jgi:two-component system response regulator AtoC
MKDARRGGRDRILCVEDHDDSRELLVAVLSRAGYEVKGAESATEALARMSVERFDLIVTDYVLPDGTGAAMVRVARARGLMRASTPLLVVTGEARAPGLEEAPLMRKPVRIEHLVRKVADLLAAHRSRVDERDSASFPAA